LNKPVIILGGGGHASVLVDILRLNSVEIIGVSDPAYLKGELVFGDIPVINDEVILEKYSYNKVSLINGIGPSPKSRRREIINEKFIDVGYEFSSVIHPSALIAKSALLESGAQIMAGVIIQSRSTVSQNSVINTGAVIDHDCFIGKYSHIAPGAVICGNVNAGSSVFIGAGATVIENLSLEEGALVAAGTTLRKNLLKEEIYYG